MRPRRPRGFWYLPGLTYDLAFACMLRGLRRRVARIVERERLFPWLDVCSGTGDQLRFAPTGGAGKRPRGQGPPVSAPFLDLEIDNLAVGLDIHFAFVRYAKARAPAVPFVCGDAARLPLKDGSIKAISISFGLHDKKPETRNAIMREARRALGPGGRLIAVDFENPWNLRSRVGALFVRAIERLAGGEHYRNGRDFLRNGGLQAFLYASGFLEVDRRDVEAGAAAVVVAQPMSHLSQGP